MYDDYKWTNVSLERNTLTKAYEPIQPQFLIIMAKMMKEAVFFDIGSNIGAYSILLGSLDQVKSVAAFEPNEFCRVEIDKNIKLNGLDSKIKTFGLALSDRQGEAMFAMSSKYGGDAGLSETHLFEEVIQSQKLVKIETLDRLFPEPIAEIVLKIDVEGHEHQALLGARHMLSSSKGFLQVEIHESNPTRTETIAYLEGLGWNLIVRIGWDYYFSNHPAMQTAQDKLNLIESGLTYIVHDSLHGKRPSRRSIFPGVTMELSVSIADKIKRVLVGLGVKRFQA